MRLRASLLAFVAVLSGLQLAVALPVFAQAGQPSNNPLTNLQQTNLSNQTPQQAANNLPIIIGNIIKVMFGLIGIILVVLFIYAGYLWMTAGGNSDQVEKAQGIMKNAVIGLIIVIMAYAITGFVVSKLICSSDPYAIGC